MTVKDNDRHRPGCSIRLLMAELNGVNVTHSELHYEGSCAIDTDLLDISGIVDSQQIEITNKTQGTRFTTYVILAEAGSGTISINGAAAHLADPGDIISISTYGYFSEEEIKSFVPVRISLDENNKPLKQMKDCG